VNKYRLFKKNLIISSKGKSHSLGSGINIPNDANAIQIFKHPSQPHSTQNILYLRVINGHQISSCRKLSQG